ncbi:MAG: hypothetical protein KBS83_03980 [Lachnospiraceae bacterium]|nr:hypothetical protein [Candidatus Equihabitans merdae]
MMKISSRYPIEAFALAFVLFTADMKTAMLVGIALVFGDVLSCLLQEATKEMKINKAIIAQISSLIMFGALMIMLWQSELSWRLVLALAAICAAQFKHAMDNIAVDEIAYGDILYADSIAYAAMVVLAILREYLANAEIFGCKLPEIPLVSSAFGKPMMALILAAITVAILNRILKTQCQDQAALWVCLPMLVLEMPFVWNNVPEILGMLVGVIMCGLIYLTMRQKLVFSETLSHIKGVPVEMTLLGIIYMVVTIL